MRWELIISGAALILAVVAIAIGVVVYRRLKSGSGEPGPLAATPATPREAPQNNGPAAFIVNPSKLSVESFQRKANSIAAELGLPEPLWWETTVDDPGTGQARDAVAQGASTVIAVGGDGTVRSVAGALEGTGVAMGLVPRGTGNLFARNLDLPLASTSRLIETALTAPIHPIDIGWVYPSGPDPDLPESTPYLVISGVGFDAAMVADADEELKARMGWLAYFFAGARHLHGKKVRVRLSLDEGPTAVRRLRSMLVANVGRLPGGFVLFPDAEVDDGLLNVASIDTRKSFVGWASLLATVVLQGLGVRIRKPRLTSDLEFWQGSSALIEVDQPAKLQVDGDIIGTITAATFKVNAGTLLMRFDPPK